MNRTERRRQRKMAVKAAKNTKPVQSASPSLGQQTLTIQQALDLALQHHTAGRLPEAESIYQRILQTDPSQPVALHLLGVIAHQVGNNELAVDLIRKAIAANPRVASYHNNLGNALSDQGRLEDAVVAYHRALELKPDHAEAHYNLGNALQKQGKLDEAVATYHKALAIKPDYAEAHSNLGVVLKDLGKLDEAVASYHKALAIRPDYADAHNNLGNAFKGLGKMDEAVASYHQALAIKPDYAEAHYNLGNALQSLGKLDEAVASYHKALAIKPDFAQVHKNLGNVFQNLGKLDEATAHYHRAVEIKPDPGIEIKIATMLPPIPASESAMLSARRTFEEQIEVLGKKGLSLDDPYKQVGQTNFYLAYHGLNDRDLQRAIARLYLKSCPSLAWTAPHCEKAGRRNAGEKLKVGFISRYFMNHSVGTVTKGIIANLPRDKFSVAVISTPQLNDKTSSFIERHADHSIVIPKILDVARRAIADLELDILVYTDIGMDPFTYFLAFSRLAPVQCVMGGHPVTTGIPSIDYFFSSRQLETDAADEHYSETLVRLDWLPVYYYRPAFPSRPKNRRKLGLPKSGALYVCPMKLFKIHPDFDVALAEILRRDPNGRVVLFRDNYSAVLHEVLLSRFRKTMPDVLERVCFLPWARKEEFMSILMQAEVVLDSFHFGGGTTAFMTFATGTPMVTWPSPYSRGRGVFGCYTAMGMTDCVAGSMDEYVDIAVRLGTDSDFRARIKDEILHRNEVLFENPAGVDAMAAFFLSLFPRDGSAG